MREAVSRHRWVLTVVFLIAAAHLSARIAGVWIARTLWSPQTGTRALSTATAEARARERLADYRIIEQRNLFNAHPTPEPAATPATPAPTETRPAPATVPLSPLNLTLLGTVVVDGGRSFAVIQDAQKNVKVVREGEEVADGAVLAAVLRDRIRIRRGDRQEEILLFRPKPKEDRARISRRPPQRGGAARSEPDGGTVRKVAEDKWIIDAREIEQAQANMSKLLTQIRVVPNFTNGQPDGFKVFAIRPGSLFAKIGLQNGDVIKRINGIELLGPEQAFEAYQRLKDETSFQIDLVRRNQNQTFTYEIR